MEKEASTWYANLVSEVNTVAEQFGLDDPSTNTLRDFVARIAKDQYKGGNKSGIRWAYKQIEEKAAAV